MPTRARRAEWSFSGNSPPTPYIVLKPGLCEWQAYFRRTSPEARQQARLDPCERHMKYGPTRTYWNDFVFEGCVNHRTEASGGDSFNAALCRRERTYGRPEFGMAA
jgi:hypothetical protein